MSALSFRPVKVAVFSFSGLMLAGVALAIAKRAGLLEAAAEKRGLGLIVGALAVVIGNFLPKIRLLSGDPLRTAAAERFAGWALVLTGIADVALFAFASLDQAKLASSILGISTMAVIALSWAGLLFARRQEAVAGGTREVMAFLLLAFFYVFANACVVFLSDEHWVRELVAWANVVLGLVFAVLYAVLMSSRSAPRAQ